MRTVLLVAAAALTLSGCATEPDMTVPEESPSPAAGTPGDATPGPGTPRDDDERTAGAEPTPQEPAGRAVITTEDDGGRFRLEPSSSAELRLDGEALWDEPTVEGVAIELASIQFFQDPGYQAWDITARREGTATIRATTVPDPAQDQRTFEVTIEVADH